MHKVEAKQMREEKILKMMGNQENQSERGLNLEDQEISNTMRN